MKNYLLLTLPIMLIGAPAMAQAGGPFRVEGLVVYDKVKADLGSDPDQFNPSRDREFDVSYGAGVGYDFYSAGGFAVGADVELTETTADKAVFVNGSEVGEIKFGNDLYAGARVTTPISGHWSAFGKIGYTSLRVRFKANSASVNEDDFIRDRLSGVRGALGVQYGNNEDATYYGAQYRYSNYEQGVIRHQAGLFVGTRF